MSDYVKLSLAASALALIDAQIADTTAFAETCSAFSAARMARRNYSHTYYARSSTGIDRRQSMLFAEGVPNAAAAHLSLMLSSKAPANR